MNIPYKLYKCFVSTNLTISDGSFPLIASWIKQSLLICNPRRTLTVSFLLFLAANTIGVRPLLWKKKKIKII